MIDFQHDLQFQVTNDIMIHACVTFKFSVINECAIPELNLCEEGCTDTDISFFCFCNDPVNEVLNHDGYECVGK